MKSFDRHIKFPKGQLSQNLKTLYLKWHVDYVNTVNFVHDQNKRHERNTIMTIKYENLITDVHNNMLNLLKFAGLPDDKINISRVPGTIKNANAKYLNKCIHRAICMSGYIHEYQI